MTEGGGSGVGQVIAFGPFRLLPEQQQLFEAEKPVRVGGRALEILHALLERPGELISKEELIARVWPSTLVEEGTLRVHLAALRRTLSDGRGTNRYIVNVPGRGYRFVAPVLHDRAQPAAPRVIAAAENPGLPAALTRMIGRAEIVDTLTTRLPQYRLITIAGPGGIGKTTVAIAVAEALSPSYADGVRLIDLSLLADPALVPSALASALGLAIRSDDPIPGLVAYLANRKMLIVLDSCERVIDGAAAMVAALVNGTSALHILATSREPLRVQGERVYRLAPLGLPARSAGLTAAEALTFPAILLFCERVAASHDSFELSDADAPIVADICRRLDGIALAIELAAGRVDVFGIAGVAARLNDQFHLLTHGRRTALPRHQTLSATLDWSYEFLAETQRVVLRRLAVLVGSFTLEAATAVAGDGEIDASDVVDHVASLVSASLVAADIAGETVTYRLLDITRAYARRKLSESGELTETARRHAAYFRDLFLRAEIESATRPAAEWLDVYGRQLDNLRAALDWAFSPHGDAALGVALAAAGVPLWMSLSLVAECRGRVEQALAVTGPAAGQDRHTMQLLSALGGVLLYTKGPGPEVNAALTQALEIAERIGDTEYRLRALWGLWIGRLNYGEYPAALALAERLRDLASSSSSELDFAIADRAMGFSRHFLGDQVEARRHLEQMIARRVTSSRESLVIRFQFDPLVTGRMRYAWVLWLLGYPDQAKHTVETNLDEVWSVDHAVTVCTAMGLGPCHVALASGDFAAAERFITALIDHATKHALALWQIWGRCLRGVLLVKQGDVAAGLPLLRATVGQLNEGKYALWYAIFLGNLAAAMGESGAVAEGLATISDAIAGAERRGEGWHIAELLRIKGELLLQQASPDTEAAERQFLQSLDWARRQGALSWELRSATSLARLRRNQGRIAEARAGLDMVCRRFTEGFDTIDLKTARTLLDAMR